MTELHLVEHGDETEQLYYEAVVTGPKFYEYEKFWQSFVIPLTNRPWNIHFRDNVDLQDQNIAQLHYTVFCGLARVHDIIEEKDDKKIDYDLLAEGFTRLVSTHDAAFDMLQRFMNRGNGKYTAFDRSDSQKATLDWRKDNSNPLKDIRYYRNILVHNVKPPSIHDDNKHLFPSPPIEARHLNWNNLTDGSMTQNDFKSAKEIIKDAWDETIVYFKAQWAKLPQIATHGIQSYGVAQFYTFCDSSCTVYITPSGTGYSH